MKLKENEKEENRSNLGVKNTLQHLSNILCCPYVLLCPCFKNFLGLKS